MNANDDLRAVRQLFPDHATWDDDGAMSLAGVSLTELARTHGTPAYLIDEDDLRRRAREVRREFTRAFEAIGSTVDVYYAGKAFLCGALVRILQEEGLSLDVCTGGELAVAQRAGFPADRIGVHGNNKSPAEIRQAVAAGVGRIIVDSFDEIERLTEAARAAGVVVPVMIRVKTGVEAHTHEYIATAHEDQKFGFSLGAGEVRRAASTILDRPDALSLLGFHSHIGSQIFDAGGFAVAAQRLIAEQLAVAAAHEITLPELDLGGGFGIAYLPTDAPLRTADMADQLAAIVDRACRESGMTPPRISIEPGRAIIGPSGITLYEVGTVKPVQVDDRSVRTYVAVDGGMSDNPRPVLYDAEYTCLLAGRRGSADTVQARVVGKHCESGDIVVRDVRLPGDIAPGDLLAVPATGAYCRSLASQYNHVPRPPVLALQGGEIKTWLRRETIDDLLALEGE